MFQFFSPHGTKLLHSSAGARSGVAAGAEAQQKLDVFHPGLGKKGLTGRNVRVDVYMYSDGHAAPDIACPH